MADHRRACGGEPGDRFKDGVGDAQPHRFFMQRDRHQQRQAEPGAQGQNHSAAKPQPRALSQPDQRQHAAEKAGDQHAGGKPFAGPVMNQKVRSRHMQARQNSQAQTQDAPDQGHISQMGHHARTSNAHPEPPEERPCRDKAGSLDLCLKGFKSVAS